ncbi:MAG: AAA family ATPase [Deltaproteobacteria bacterium]|jgi:hypothetical protein|nr:AAA family ATPase [Deltaproteobacteria bacterium]
MAPKKLPVSDLTFREIIQQNCLYADKTKYIYRMINNYKNCFLARPRRFGKTLLIDTIEELFTGNRELFKGLWIDTKQKYAFEKHPVLRFNMSYSKISTREDFEGKLENDLREAAEIEKISLSSNSYDDMLGDLLKGIHKKHATGVVVLVDEYDDPISSFITDRKLATDNLNILRGFFKTLKRQNAHIHFAFATGVTSFSLTAMGSGANNFKNISLKPKFAGICGFTISEFTKLFKNRFKGTRNRLKTIGDIGPDAGIDDLVTAIMDWYDGYNWQGPQHVLNPYSILNFFDDKELKAYWPQSGQTSLLSSLVRERPLEFIQPSLDGFFAKSLDTVELGRLDAIPVLYHNGYLTIDNRIRMATPDAAKDGEANHDVGYTFKTPNREIKLHYKSSLFQGAFDLLDEDFYNFAKDLKNALRNQDSQTLAEILRKLLSAISAFQHVPSEKHYHSTIQAAFLAAGLEVFSEVPGAHGRPDMSIFLHNRVRMVLELKYCPAEVFGQNDESLSAKELAKALEEAEKAIREKDYTGLFRLTARNIMCIALAVRGRNEVAARIFELQSDDSHQST